MFPISHLLKTLYAHFTRLAWSALLVLVLAHVLLSYGGIRLFETGEITERVAFWYFYMTTVTTIGYGDISPKSAGGRLITTLWIMPGGIMLFTVSLAKFIKFVADRWRKRMRGEADYSYLEGHIVILGWQGMRTQRMVQEIRADEGGARREIVLCTTKEIDNPMPEQLKFVRDSSLSSSDLHRRAGSAGAAVIIVYGHDDNDTLAAALAAAAVNHSAHLVAHFDRKSFSDLLTAHCPRAETMIPLSIELMARAALDAGSSRVHRELIAVGGQNNFSMRVPAGVPPLRYGALLQSLKAQYNVTIIAMAHDTAGNGLRPNAPADTEVKPGAVLYYIAEQRLDPDEVNWRATPV